MSNKEYEVFKNNYLQRPITFLTEENLDKLETHCRKAIHYERGVEHQVVLELLERHKKHLSEREQDKNRINELEEENKLLLNGKVGVDLSYDDYIPKQKVKDKIEELKNDLKLIACNKDCSKCFNKEGKALYRGSNFVFCYAYHQIKVLEELLEKK